LDFILHSNEMILKLVVAILLGGLIGIDREFSKRPAGLRTHILVVVGATVVMHTNIALLQIYPHIDPGRFGAQVISGIGFLGAGTIIKEGPTIHGLTTAASLWTVSAIGLAVGSAQYTLAVLATLITLVVLRIFSTLENRFRARSKVTALYLETNDDRDVIDYVHQTIEEKELDIVDLSSDYTQGYGHSLIIKLKCEEKHCRSLIQELANSKKILKIRMR